MARADDAAAAKRSMATAGFVDMRPETVVPSLAVCSHGPEKKGKTHFAFTMPGPLAVIASDTGTEPIAARHLKKKKVSMFRYRVPRQGLAIDHYVNEWKKVKNAILSVVDNRDMYRGLIIDTGTEIWELCRLAAFGKLTQVMPHHYGPVNAEFRDLIKAVVDAPGLNSVWIHQEKKEYITDAKTQKDGWNGRYERAGFSNMPYLCDIPIKHYLNRDTNTFGIDILDSRYHPDVLLSIGQLEDDMCNFATLASLAWPETELSDWE